VAALPARRPNGRRKSSRARIEIQVSLAGSLPLKGFAAFSGAPTPTPLFEAAQSSAVMLGPPRTERMHRSRGQLPLTVGRIGISGRTPLATAGSPWG
jgi:hypothetical protein